MNKNKYLRISSWSKILCFALLSFPVLAQDGAMSRVPRHAPYPGGVAVVEISDRQAPIREVLFNGKRVLTLRQSGGLLAVVGLPLDVKPGKQTLQVNTHQDSPHLPYEFAFEVKAKTYPAQHLKISSRFMQPTADDMKRIERDQVVIERAKQHWSDSAPESFVLDLPANGRLSARFGLRRVLNGKEGSPHAGLDVAVGTGTPLRAAAQGRVIATGDYFFSGKSVFVDHGQGFITLYIHMSRVDVKDGEKIERGATLGLSGAGPHLHWAVLLNGVYVDPELFLKPER
jgi:murein DD-endopeptidase MepM/ murein hydrolase activator NlpD